MRTQRHFFQNAHGERLAAWLDFPISDRPLAYALFAHCFTCTKNFKAVAHISRALTQNGLAVLRFDFTGLGDSEGDFADTAFSSNISDLIAASEFLSREFAAPKLLIGHSLGGTAVLRAAKHIPSALAVSTIGSPFEPVHVARLLRDQEETIEREGEAEVLLAGRPFKIKKQFLDDLKQHHLQDDLRVLNKALLILHSPVDHIVAIDNAQAIFTAARHPKSFISLDQADHLLSQEEDSLYVGALIAAWARKYIGIDKSKREGFDLASAQVATRTGKEGFLTEINANGHLLLADEPVAVGGTNLGPSPYDYLVSALGACTGMTLRLYADRKSWPLDAVEVRLTHSKNHAQDCADCETKEGMIDTIQRDIQLFGTLSDEQRKKLMEIADKCPVHRTLHGEVKVRSRLLDS